MIRNLMRHLSVGTVILLSVAMIASCADDDEAAGEGEGLRPITATPTTVVGLPEDIEEAQIIIEDGEFDEDSLSTIAEQPVILTFVNRDAETYTFVVDTIITETEIPAAAESTIEFNVPTSGNHEGRLLGPDGEEVDTILFEVTGPGGL